MEAVRLAEGAEDDAEPASDCPVVASERDVATEGLVMGSAAFAALRDAVARLVELEAIGLAGEVLARAVAIESLGLVPPVVADGRVGVVRGGEPGLLEPGAEARDSMATAAAPPGRVMVRPGGALGEAGGRRGPATGAAVSAAVAGAEFAATRVSLTLRGASASVWVFSISESRWAEPLSAFISSAEATGWASGSRSIWLRGAARGGAGVWSAPGRSLGIRPLLLIMAAIFSIWRWAASGGIPPPRAMVAGPAPPAGASGAPGISPAGTAAAELAEVGSGALAAVRLPEGELPAAAGAPTLTLSDLPAAAAAAISAAVRFGRKRGTISSAAAGFSKLAGRWCRCSGRDLGRDQILA